MSSVSKCFIIIMVIVLSVSVEGARVQNLVESATRINDLSLKLEFAIIWYKHMITKIHNTIQFHTSSNLSNENSLALAKTDVLQDKITKFVKEATYLTGALELPGSSPYKAMQSYYNFIKNQTTPLRESNDDYIEYNRKFLQGCTDAIHGKFKDHKCDQEGYCESCEKQKIYHGWWIFATFSGKYNNGFDYCAPIDRLKSSNEMITQASLWSELIYNEALKWATCQEIEQILHTCINNSDQPECQFKIGQ